MEGAAVFFRVLVLRRKCAVLRGKSKSSAIFWKSSPIKIRFSTIRQAISSLITIGAEPDERAPGSDRIACTDCDLRHAGRMGNGGSRACGGVGVGRVAD